MASEESANCIRSVLTGNQASLLRATLWSPRRNHTMIKLTATALLAAPEPIRSMT